jgi:hypothetical protein
VRGLGASAECAASNHADHRMGDRRRPRAQDASEPSTLILGLVVGRPGRSRPPTVPAPPGPAPRPLIRLTPRLASMPYGSPLALGAGPARRLADRPHRCLAGFKLSEALRVRRGQGARLPRGRPQPGRKSGMRRLAQSLLPSTSSRDRRGTREPPTPARSHIVRIFISPALC